MNILDSLTGARADGPPRDETFADLGLPPTICKAIAAAGISEPFPIQAAVIPDVLAGLDVCGRAPTGSGKTLAFGLPLVARLLDAGRRAPGALILAPTRELAEQISRALSPYAAALGHKVVTVYGGVGYGAQRKLLDQGAEMVVACPGRLEDLVKMGALRLDKVTAVVIDEADQMADMGFLPAVRRIVSATAAQRQVLLFSATLDGPVAKLVDDFQDNPCRHEVGEKGPDVTAAHHMFWLADRTDRPRHVAGVAAALGSTLVFCRTRHGADRLAKQLDKFGTKAEAIHGGRSQAQRDRALESFKRGRIGALIATDVAARGVHVDGIACVLHFDPPADAATYHHRSGRTARAGATGVVISLVDASMRKATRQLQQQIGVAEVIEPADPRRLSAHVVPVVRTETERSPRATASPATATALDGSSTVGTIKFFSPARGYGFIARPGAEDLFVHHTNISHKGAKATATLTEGQRVRYTIAAGRRGPEAVAVSPA
jgi:superfamily II DNA/RNA helicase